MDNRIFIIHGSEVIRFGLLTTIQNQIGMDPIAFSNPTELKSYQSITKSNIVFLVDSQLDKEIIDEAISFLDTSNSFHFIKIYDRSSKDMCTDTCQCCYSLMDPVSEIEELLNQHLGVVPDVNASKNSTTLSEREVDVVKLVAIGKTNKEIADSLHISFHTVISHRKNITEKLGIKSISGITVYAILNNLIDASIFDLE